MSIHDTNIRSDYLTQNTDIIFNYSNTVLTEPMNKLLNRALNFAVLPLKLDITQVLVDFNRFSRTAIWTEYWHGRDPLEKYSSPQFPHRKTNLPKKHNTPNGLKTF